MSLLSIPMRAASMRARSTAQPRSSPVAGSFVYSGGNTAIRTLPTRIRSSTRGSAGVLAIADPGVIPHGGCGNLSTCWLAQQQQARGVSAVVHHNKLGRSTSLRFGHLAMPAQCPVWPTLQTQVGHLARSKKCQTGQSSGFANAYQGIFSRNREFDRGKQSKPAEPQRQRAEGKTSAYPQRRSSNANSVAMWDHGSVEIPISLSLIVLPSRQSMGGSYER